MSSISFGPQGVDVSIEGVDLLKPLVEQASRSAGSADASARQAAQDRATSTGAADTATAARDAAALNKTAAETANNSVQPLAITIGRQAEQTAADRVLAQQSAQAAQGAVSNAATLATSSILLGGGVVIGEGASYDTSGAGVIVGYQAGLNAAAGTARSLSAIGGRSGQYFKGYASCLMGVYSGQYMISDYSISYGTHSGQYQNAAGYRVYGFGTGASGTLTFTSTPAAGDTATLGGVVFTFADAASGSYQVARGGSAAEAARNLWLAIVAAPDLALKSVMTRAAGAVLTVQHQGRDETGNAFGLAVSSAAIATSGATLLGGQAATNPGNQAEWPGAINLGWEAAFGANPFRARASGGAITFSGQPAVGDSFVVGVNAGGTFTFVAAATNASQITIGATLTETLVNAATVLNAATSALVNGAFFWPSGNVLRVLYKTNTSAGSLYQLTSRSSVITTSAALLRPGAGGVGDAPVAIGYQANKNAVQSSSISIGSSAGSGSVGTASILMGGAAGNVSFGSYNIFVGDGAGRNIHGSYNLLLGSSIAQSVPTGSYQPISAVAADGTITFAGPHGFNQGAIYRLFQRNQTNAGDIIKVNGASAGTAIAVSVVNERQVRFIPPNVQDAVFVYSVTGTVSNIEIAAQVHSYSFALSIGHGAPIADRTIHLGGDEHWQTVITGGGLRIAKAGLRTQVMIPGAQAIGTILFASGNGNFVDGETVTLNGTVFTAKTAASLANPNTLGARWFRIGADMADSLDNLLTRIRNSDDQTASARVVNRARFYIQPVSGAGWQLRAQVDKDTDGNSFTLATSKAGATVTASNGQTLGNLPLRDTITQNWPLGPQDGDLAGVTSSPLRNGQPGFVRFNATLNRWDFI